MAAKQFDSATYLRGLGWQGPGSSLNNSANGRAKPVTVVQKKTLAGIGRDRDTSFAWWDAVFSSVANKVGSTQPEQRRTTTGILSHRPPPPKANAYDETPHTQSSGLNLDAMAAVKLEQARRQLYSGFLRGSVISGSKDEEDEDAATGSKGKKRSRDEDDDDEEQSSPALSKAERKAARAARKEAKAQKKLDKEARRAAKKKKGKSAAGGESATGDDLSSSTTSASASASRATSVDTIGSNSTAEPNLREKALRRQQRKPTTTSAETPSSTGSASSTPLPSEVEALDVEDELTRARKAIRRAAKEERRAARAVAVAAVAGAAS